MSIFSSKHSASAKVVDGSLVLSLPDAVMPVVMRLSLDDVRSATLGVEEKDEYFYLVVRFSETEARDIAPYDRREQAVNALMTASSALEKGSRSGSDAHISGNIAHTSSASKGTALKWLGTFAVLILLVYVIFSLNGNMPRVPGSVNASSAGAGQATASASGAGQAQTGVPMSADNFLSSRGQ